jgi:hypothetical protein
MSLACVARRCQNDSSPRMVTRMVVVKAAHDFFLVHFKDQFPVVSSKDILTTTTTTTTAAAAAADIRGVKNLKLYQQHQRQHQLELSFPPHLPLSGWSSFGSNSSSATIGV